MIGELTFDNLFINLIGACLMLYYFTKMEIKQILNDKITTKYGFFGREDAAKEFN